jgi:UDP-glucose 4-epimerase
LKILILGSEGFVGNNLVQELSSKNDVFCADIFDNSNHQHYQQCDVTNFDNVLNVVNDVDVVIDLVAHSLVSSIDGPITNAKINIMGLLNILESCRKNDVKKIIFTSASSMIGIPQTSNVSETHPASPQTAYGITKLTSEHYLRLYQEMYGLNYTVFRFFNIYGPHQKNGLIPTLYYRIKNNEPLTVFGKGDQIRDYVFIQDVIPFFQKACESDITNNTIFNMGTGIGNTILEVIKQLSEITGIDPSIEYKPERPGEIGNFVADTKLLSATFGDVPKTLLHDGLTNTVNWLESLN